MRCLTLLLLIGVITACQGETAEDEVPQEVFVSDTTLIDTLYPPIDDFCKSIMEKLEICTLSDTVLTQPPCTHQFFRVFDYRPNKDWSAGFIVEMIPGLYGSPVHQLVVIEEYLGKYRIVNQYLGHLLEIRTQFSGYSDLLIGYNDPDVGHVAMKHVWTGNGYEPVDVEEINYHYVKPEYKDSINAIFIPAFSAGH
ncbi:MAG: hypothetical protein WDZ35_08570 [Crocinitomicaceae bacterium]